MSDVNITEPITINFFSNILDIETVNLEKLTELIKSNLKGEQYFVCVGPTNIASTRIDTFAKLLNCTEEQLIGKQKGRLKTTRGTIKLLVFKIKGKEIEIIKSIYYSPIPNNNNIIHILDKKLKEIDIHKLSPLDRIMEYYKLVVELEQIKEPVVDNYYPYNYTLNENNDFIVDLEGNKSFLTIFNKNKKEKWPKNLNITIEIDIEQKKYPILNYTYLFDYIKEIDITKEKIKLQLSSFELNYSTLTSKFEKDEEGIDQLEYLIKQQNSIEEIINTLKNELGSNLTFDNQLSLALSSKNPALSQIYSELKKVNSNYVTENSLLSNFLFNKLINNKLNDYSKDDLIQISNLDDSQKKAVLTAFNNKVSVITGPPGSGKTQVISNILANAVLQNKKVLVASKNNQAVDNVKSRFDREESLGFFLRFGNKRILRDTTLPEINRISGLQSTLSDNAIQLNESKEKLKQITKTKLENKKKLKQRDYLTSNLSGLKQNIESIKTELLQLSQRNLDFENLRLKYQVEVIKNFIFETKKKRNQFDLKYSRLNKLWINTQINRISKLKSTLSDNAIQLNVNKSKEKLKQRDFLTSKLPELKLGIENIKTQLLLLSKRSLDFENLRLKYQVEVIKNFIFATKEKLNQFDLKYSGLNKLWIDWFTKKQNAFELINFLNITLKDFKDIFKLLPDEISNFKNGEKILETYNEIIKILNSVVDYYTNYSKIESELKSKTEELNHIENYISTIKQYAFELINFVNIKLKDFKDIFKLLPDEISDFENGKKILETYNEIIKILNSVVDYYTNYSKIESELKSKTEELNRIENYISTINSQEEEILQIIANCDIEIIEQGKVILEEKIKNKLFNASLPQINNYKDYLPDNIPWRYEDLNVFKEVTKKFLDIFNIISVTSLSAKASLSLSNELFDMVVIDEASQCDIASAIPLILRANQLVVIGDPLQLKHITSLSKFEEERIKEHLLLSGAVYLKYKEKSLWDYSERFVINANDNNKVVNIDRHYRCHPDIIGYSNEAFYNPRLQVDLKICTKNEDFKIEPNGIKWIDIKGIQRANNVNINDKEVLKSIEIATYFAKKSKDITIGIVTPFHQQAKEIHSKIPAKLHQQIVANTVHKFQGDEKDVMIYSLVVTNNSPDSKIYWIDNMVPESVNVAITRARNTIYIVGNKEYIKLKSKLQKPLGKLVDYVEKIQN